jgi:hypothetical protein
MDPKRTQPKPSAELVEALSSLLAAAIVSDISIENRALTAPPGATPSGFNRKPRRRIALIRATLPRALPTEMNTPEVVRVRGRQRRRRTA